MNKGGNNDALSTNRIERGKKINRARDEKQSKWNVRPLHFSIDCVAEKTQKAPAKTECDSCRRMLFPTSAFQRHVPLCFARVFTHGHFENIALIATVPNRCLHLIQWFPGVQQLNEYKRDSLILSKSMEEGRATPAPPPPSIPFWDNSSISLALAATMPYSSLCQWNNTASVAMDRAQQQLRAYADIPACEADASVFLHSNDASFF